MLTIVQENLDENFEMRKPLKSRLWVLLASVLKNRGGRPDAARPAADVLDILVEKKSCLKNTIPENIKTSIANKHRKSVNKFQH